VIQFARKYQIDHIAVMPVDGYSYLVLVVVDSGWTYLEPPEAYSDSFYIDYPYDFDSS